MAYMQPQPSLQPWFLRFQRDTMALPLAGDQAPFERLARELLRRLLAVGG